jgi:hypothetical protein
MNRRRRVRVQGIGLAAPLAAPAETSTARRPELELGLGRCVYPYSSNAAQIVQPDMYACSGTCTAAEDHQCLRRVLEGMDSWI